MWGSLLTLDHVISLRIVRVAGAQWKCGMIDKAAHDVLETAVS